MILPVINPCLGRTSRAKHPFFQRRPLPVRRRSHPRPREKPAHGMPGRPAMVPPSLLAASRFWRGWGFPVRDPEHGEHLYVLATILPAPWPGHPPRARRSLIGRRRGCPGCGAVPLVSDARRRRRRCCPASRRRTAAAGRRPTQTGRRRSRTKREAGKTRKRGDILDTADGGSHADRYDGVLVMGYAARLMVASIPAIFPAGAGSLSCTLPATRLAKLPLSSRDRAHSEGYADVIAHRSAGLAPIRASRDGRA